MLISNWIIKQETHLVLRVVQNFTSSVVVAAGRFLLGLPPFFLLRDFSWLPGGPWLRLSHGSTRLGLLSLLVFVGFFYVDFVPRDLSTCVFSSAYSWLQFRFPASRTSWRSRSARCVFISLAYCSLSYCYGWSVSWKSFVSADFLRLSKGTPARPVTDYRFFFLFLFMTSLLCVAITLTCNTPSLCVKVAVWL